MIGQRSPLGRRDRPTVVRGPINRKELQRLKVQQVIPAATPSGTVATPADWVIDAGTDKMEQRDSLAGALRWARTVQAWSPSLDNTGKVWYVSDTVAPRQLVRAFAASGAVEASFPIPGTGIVGAGSVILVRDKFVYVHVRDDALGSPVMARVYKFDYDGNFLIQSAPVGFSGGTYSHPVTADVQGDLYVTGGGDTVKLSGSSLAPLWSLGRQFEAGVVCQQYASVLWAASSTVNDYKVYQYDLAGQLLRSAPIPDMDTVVSIRVNHKGWALVSGFAPTTGNASLVLFDQDANVIRKGQPVSRFLENLYWDPDGFIYGSHKYSTTARVYKLHESDLGTLLWFATHLRGLTGSGMVGPPGKIDGGWWTL